MNNESLKDKEKKILILRHEIKQLKQKEKELEKLESEYYHEYFDMPRDDFSLLTNIPYNPDNNKHVLYDYSILNVDTIGKIICKLIKKYENKDVVAKRLIYYTDWEDAFGNQTLELPRLVIGEEDKIERLDKEEQNIIIEYDDFYDLEDYPTNNPVRWWSTSSRSLIRDYVETSNYRSLIDTRNGLDFQYPANQEYIEELIYSLAYYQREHNIKFMGPKETWNTYRKIYKKSNIINTK